jgi:hypothetical protein
MTKDRVCYNFLQLNKVMAKYKLKISGNEAEVIRNKVSG